MIKHWNSNLGIFGLLRESFKALKGNRNLLLPFLVSVYLIEPVAKHIILQLVKRSQLLQDLGNNMNDITGYDIYRSSVMPIVELLLINIFILNFCSITPLFFFNATEAPTSKLIDLKEMILKIDNSRNKVALTSFHMYLVIMGPIFVWFCSTGIILVLEKGLWACVLYGVLGLSVIVYEFYVSALGMMSLVVSALEDVGGLNAIVRARGLMKGKNVQACLIMVLFVLAYGVVHSTTNGGKLSRLGVLIHLSKGLLSTLKLFVFVVFIVFYIERRERCDEKEAKSESSL